MKTPDTPRDGAVLSASDLVDETSDESFPASDPPGWSHLHLGTPIAHAADEPDARTVDMRDRADRT